MILILQIWLALRYGTLTRGRSNQLHRQSDFSDFIGITSHRLQMQLANLQKAVKSWKFFTNIISFGKERQVKEPKQNVFNTHSK